MQLKTILNRIQQHRGFVYGEVQFEEQIGGLAVTIAISPHARNRPRCSGCGHHGVPYDRLAPRRFEFVPLWGLRVFFLYMMLAPVSDWSIWAASAGQLGTGRSCSGSAEGASRVNLATRGGYDRP